MSNSNPSSNKPLIPNWLPAIFLVLSAIGFADATYLTVKHFLGTPVACSLLHGCEVVLTSRFATIAGIPIALLGCLYYFTVLIFTTLYLQTKKAGLLKIAACLVTVGFLVSLGLVYLQLFVLKSICLYCMSSAITSTTLFILSLVFWKKAKSNSNTSLEEAGV